MEGATRQSSRATPGVAWLTANGGSGVYQEPMSNVTQTELVEMVPGLRALARVETSTEVRAALNRLAERYAAMAAGRRNPSLAATASEFAT
jgi:predicted DNA-binding transcriptional regulator YafY